MKKRSSKVSSKGDASSDVIATPLLTCSVCQESFPPSKMAVVNGTIMTWCAGCHVVDEVPELGEERAARVQQGRDFLSKAKMETKCRFCGGSPVHTWYKKDMAPVDWETHIEVKGMPPRQIREVMQVTTPLCSPCSGIRHTHPYGLQKQLERLFTDVRKAALMKNEPLRRRLFIEFKAKQREVEMAKSAWLRERDARAPGVELTEEEEKLIEKE